MATSKLGCGRSWASLLLKNVYEPSNKGFWYPGNNATVELVTKRPITVRRN